MSSRAMTISMATPVNTTMVMIMPIITITIITPTSTMITIIMVIMGTITTITPIATIMRDSPHRNRKAGSKLVVARARVASRRSFRKAPSDLPRHASTADDQATLFRLMTWLSPSFPVGAFSYSSGIEWAVETGDVTDAGTLKDWLGSMLADGQGFCDGIFLAHSHAAARDGNDDALAGIAELAAAFVPSRERRLETTSQGRAFVDIARDTWPCPALTRLIAMELEAVAYPVAVGVVSAGHELPLPPTLAAFLHAQTANWISAAVRLIPLGQTDGQRVLAALEPVIHDTAERAARASLDDLGSSTFRVDIAGMRHEAQYTRLFRS
jgi:urease accessory protein